MNPSPPILDYAAKGNPRTGEIIRRLIAYLLLAALGGAISIGLTFLPYLRPVYRSSAILQINSIPSKRASIADAFPLDSEVAAAGKQMQASLSAPAFRQRVLGEMAKAGMATPTTDELSSNLEISYIQDTKLIRVQATNSSPAAAAAIASVGAESAILQFKGQAPSLMYVCVPEKPFRPADLGKPIRPIATLTGGVFLPLAIWLKRRSKSSTD